MTDAQLILTGGTLSAVRNASGLLEPSSHTVHDLALSLGYSDILKPYTIDSIDFDFSVHYPLLRDAAFAALDKKITPIICGGTDTLSWYSALLTHEAMRRGYLLPGQGQKIIFLSAMRTLHDAPELVANILRAGLMVADEGGFEGGFALSAKSMEDTTLDIHDVTNQLDKISAELLNAFRSHAPIAFIRFGEIVWNPAYQKPAGRQSGRPVSYARIAPSLLRGHSTAALITYLGCLAARMDVFDGVLIEGLPIQIEGQELARLRALVSSLSTAGKHVTICNPVRYSNEFECMLPVIDPAEWENKCHRLRLPEWEQHNVQFTTGLPKDIFVQMMLDVPARAQPGMEAETIPPAGSRQKFLGIRYVPQRDMMRHIVDIVAPATENILFSSLPGGVMPSLMLPVLEGHAGKTRFWSMFDYEGNRYVDFNGRTFVESHKNTYAAGQDTARLVQPYNPH